MPTNKKDFRDIKTCFCFLDETGLLQSPRDKFFAIGILKCDEPERIYNKIRKVRQKYNYNEELKWSILTRKIRFDIAREFFNIFLSEKAEFNCIILNKDELDFKKYYDDDLYKVYRNFAIALLKLMIGKTPDEIIIILADDYFSPEGTNLEATIKKFTNDHYKKFVVAGVCQIDSKSSDLLQIADLILGVIIFDLKKQKEIIEGKNIYKRKFVNFVYQKLNIKNSFFKHNILKYELSNYISPEISRKNYAIRKGKIKATIFDSKKSINRKFL